MSVQERRSLSVVVRAGGRSLRLSTPEKWRRAIQLRDLERSTVVEVDDGDRRSSMRAGDVPELALLFEELSPGNPPAAPVQNPPDDASNQAPDASAEEIAAVGAAREPETIEPEAIESETIEPDAIEPGPAESEQDAAPPRMQNAQALLHSPAFEPAAATPAADLPRAPSAVAPVAHVPPAPEPTKARPRPWIWVMGLAILTLVGLAYLGSRNNASAPAGETWYATRQLRLRSEPSAANPATVTGSLSRGDRIDGALVTDGDGRWVRITSGPHAKDYVSSVNLSRTVPPELTVVFHDAGPEPTLSDTQVRSLPDGSGEPLSAVKAGAGLLRVGALANHWVEVTLRKGGVGYVPWDVFADAPQVAAAPAPQPAPAPVPAPAPPATFGRAEPPQARPAAPPVQTPAPAPEAPVAPELIGGPKFQARPSQQDYATYLPAAIRQGQAGSVTLNCAVTSGLLLTDCYYEGESPQGSGLGRAVIALSRFYQLYPIAGDGFPVAGRRVALAITFRPQS